MLEDCSTELSSMDSYRVQAEKKSLFNTPPCFAIYVVNKVLAAIEDEGGLSAMEQRNRRKADHLYGFIDKQQDFYRCPVPKEDRSYMNVVFRLPTEALEQKFIAEAKQKNIIGIKGHRSVGGMRASIYNGIPYEWVDTLVQFMEQFVSQNG